MSPPWSAAAEGAVPLTEPIAGAGTVIETAEPGDHDDGAQRTVVPSSQDNYLRTRLKEEEEESPAKRQCRLRREHWYLAHLDEEDVANLHDLQRMEYDDDHREVGVVLEDYRKEAIAHVATAAQRIRALASALESSIDGTSPQHWRDLVLDADAACSQLCLSAQYYYAHYFYICALQR